MLLEPMFQKQLLQKLMKLLLILFLL